MNFEEITEQLTPFFLKMETALEYYQQILSLYESQGNKREAQV